MADPNDTKKAGDAPEMERVPQQLEDNASRYPDARKRDAQAAEEADEVENDPNFET